jgi:two-component system chemotaxis response regulator CheB
MTRVLIVDDSGIAREVLSRILSSDPEIQVIGTATNGIEAIEFIARNRPDIVTMDIIMPKMDGYEATRRIMETDPLPVVVVSASFDADEVEKSFRAVEAGAVAVLEKPRLSDIGQSTGDGAKLIQTVKAMAEVKVIKRRRRTAVGLVEKPAKPKPDLPPLLPGPKEAHVRIVAIGASTGGPGVLQDILTQLPGNFGAPILVVQHISPGFVEGLVNWLNSSCKLTVRLAGHGCQALPGCVYVAPDGFQMKVDNRDRISLTTDDDGNVIRPSVSQLFRSVAHAYGRNAVGVLLTGMGRDGAEDLKLMRDKGAITIAQDEESSIVYGMPAEAVKMNAAQYSLPPRKIVEVLRHLVM